MTSKNQRNISPRITTSGTCSKCNRESNRHHHQSLREQIEWRARKGHKQVWNKCLREGQLPVGVNEEEVYAFYLDCQQQTEDTGAAHEVDHIKPLSMGGKHRPENLRVVNRIHNIRRIRKP